MAYADIMAKVGIVFYYLFFPCACFYFFFFLNVHYKNCKKKFEVICAISRDPVAPLKSSKLKVIKVFSKIIRSVSKHDFIYFPFYHCHGDVIALAFCLAWF